MAPRISKAPEIGTFNETPAACTQLACGADCVVTIGLCGRLRAWRTDGTGWQLVVDESSASTGYESAASIVDAMDESWGVSPPRRGRREPPPPLSRSPSENDVSLLE